MRSERVDETLLVGFLLGNLTEEEQVQVEDRAFADPNYLNMLDAVEADLIDSYVRGDLSPGDRRNFERRFMTSPGRLSKLEFARALARVAAEGKATSSSVSHLSGWQALLILIRGWNPAFRMAMGMAALICIVGGSWLMVQNAAMRSRVAALEAQGRAMGLREQELRRELAANSQQPPPAAPPPAPAPIIATLVFVPGLTRAETNRSQLVLSGSTQIVRTEIQLEARDAYPRFRAELRTTGGQDVLTQDNLHERRTNGGYSVMLDLPASALTAGEYELALKGLAEGQSGADIAFYYFTVRKQ